MNALNGHLTAQLRYDVKIRLVLTHASAMKDFCGSTTNVAVIRLIELMHLQDVPTLCLIFIRTKSF